MLKFKDKIDKLPQDDSARDDQKFLLYSFIRASKPKTVVEVGTHKGVTSLYLAHALYDNKKGHLHTFDPLEYGQEENFKMFPELDEYITYHRDKGSNYNGDKIDFLFIDGFHEESYVLEEIKKLFPQLSKDAFVFFHDAGGDNDLVGVNSAIEKAGLTTVRIPLSGTMRLYCHD